MWVRQIILGLTGLSAGFVVAGGLFAFISGLGVTSDFADRTHTGDKIHWYEMSVALGGICGNLVSVYQIKIPYGTFLMPVFGIFAGIFVGCWAMALAELLNLFPVFIRKTKTFQAIPWIILGIAVGKGLGSLLFYYMRW